MKENMCVESYDCTIREGRQAMGVNLSLEAMIAIIGLLDELGVDLIEVGWPGAARRWDQLFERIAAKEVSTKRAKLVAFGSTRKAKLTVEIDPIFRKVISAPVDVVALFGKAWLRHVTEVLKTDPGTNLAMIRESLAAVRQEGKEAFFDAEHIVQSFLSGYTDKDYALQVLDAAVEGGASRIVLCDTNGIAYPWQVEEIVREVIKHVGPEIVVGVHLHGDRGMDTANTLAAIRGGALHFQGTVNGYSERVRMACTLEVLANLHLLSKQDQAWARVSPEFKPEMLKYVSGEVDLWSGLHPNHRKPFVGKAAGTHKAGVHGKAVDVDPSLYESHDPAEFGRRRYLVISSMAGKANVKACAQELWGIANIGDDIIRQILDRVEDLEGQGYCLDSAMGTSMLLIARQAWKRAPSFDRDIKYIIVPPPDESALQGAQVATVQFEDGKLSSAAGDGPVDALFKALVSQLQRDHDCLAGLNLYNYDPYQLRASGLESTSAKMRVEISWTHERFGKFTTQGISTNLIDASWEAILEAVELVLIMQWRQENYNEAPEIDA